MSVLFPKVNKAPTWNWRPIYYDPKKEEMEQKLRKLQNDRVAAEKEAAASQDAPSAQGTAPANESTHYSPTLHRGSFREAHQEKGAKSAQHTSKIVFWVVLVGMLLLMYWCLS